MADTTPSSDKPVAPVAKHGKQLERFRTPLSPSGRRIRLGLWVVFGLVLIGLGWLGITAYATYQKVSDPATGSSPFLKYFGQTVQPDQLKGEGDGRINILLIGIGGANHAGGTLADTIIVASIDPVNKKLAMLSIPRDFRVKLPDGSTGKINAAHSLGELKGAGQGPQFLMDTVSKTIDLPIQYYARADFTGFEKFIDALGGVTVNVQKPLYDPFFPADNMVDYAPFSIKAGEQKLNGTTALKYARSRETTSDFDRAARQQQILIAVRDKVLSANVIGNPQKMSELTAILGDHLKMDLSLTDIQHMFEIVKSIDQNQIVTKVLDNSPDGPLKSISDGGYYLIPKTGNFKEVQRIAHELFTDPNLTKEQAKIEILNGTGEAGKAKELQLDLAALGYTIVSIDTTPTTDKTTLSDYTAGKVPFTARFLTDRLHAALITATRHAGTTADLRLVLGTDYQPTDLTP